MGTYGYAAPEYVMTGEFDCNHIFGFGNYFYSKNENYWIVMNKPSKNCIPLDS